MRLTGAEILAETLIAHSVTDVFGFPGGAVIDLYDALYKYQDKITHYLTCHEQGAAHAADGYARATGKTGVVIATSGPGATNLVTGIATAYLDSTPMVAITGNVALSLIGKDSFQEVDIVGITMPITKHNYMVKNAAELEETIREAFQIARSGRPGPVLIDIPKDVQQATFEFHGGRPKPPLPTAKVDEQVLLDAVRLINSSQRPYIYAGGGLVACDSGAALQAFAEKIDAPIGLSIMGLTALDSKHPLKHGITGMHGHFVASKMNAEADLIIGIGVRFSDRATGSVRKYQEKAKIIHIDIDGAEVDKNVDSLVSLVGDAAEILPRLTELVDRRDNPEWKARADVYRQAAEKSQGNGNTPPPPPTQPNTAASANSFTPRDIILKVREFTSDDTVIATDVGQHQMWVAQHYDFARPRTLLTSGGLGTMGFGMGAAIGAAIAKGGGAGGAAARTAATGTVASAASDTRTAARTASAASDTRTAARTAKSDAASIAATGAAARTVLFTGDGSFHMNLNELATAVTYKLPLVVIIFNNQALGMVRQWQALFYSKRYSNTTLQRATDYPKLAEAFGGKGYQASNMGELQMALGAAFSAPANGPTLIECLIDPDEKVFPIIPPGGSFDDMIVE
jgi:acetolactate synthase-1/2/3 large subunit